jgi:hypothetical protein
VAVLSPAARLADEFAFAFGRAGDGLAVGDLGRTGVGVHLELAQQPIANDLEVQLAHAGDDQLSGLLVGETAEGRILLREALETFRHLVAIVFGLRLNRHADDRLGEGRRLEQYVELLVAQRIARRDVPQTDQGRDIARIHRIHILAFAALDDHEAADALATAGSRIVDRVSLGQVAAVDAEKDELPGIGIRPKLEG